VIKAESDYYPWGGELQFVNNDSNDYKFTGKKRDLETGLDYFGARYYSNGLGRWVSADWSAMPVPVPYANFSDPQTLNLYRYPSNPETYADPDGHCDWCQRLWNKLNGNGWRTDAEIEAAEIKREREYLINKLVSMDGKKKDYSKASDEEVKKDFQKILDAQKAGKAEIVKPDQTKGGTPPNTNPVGPGPGQSTGRTQPNNLKEQLAMEQAQSNPTTGQQIRNIQMKDPRWPASQGWVKMRQNINGIEIHYVRNTVTGAVADFKFVGP
jgi:RHS repeat-associated protein